MSDWNLPREGSCRCGEVRFRISAPPMFTMACHCRGCQKMSASAFSLSAAIPSAGCEVLTGEPVRGGAPSAQLHHQHCPTCKSWLFTRIEPDMGFVNVRTAMLDDASDLDPFVETWTSEALPWASTSAVRSYPGFPDPSEYGPVMAEFAARAER